MPKGKNKKPDHLKSGETTKGQKNVETSDDLSTVDTGHDFVKAGETPRISNRQV